MKRIIAAYLICTCSYALGSVNVFSAEIDWFNTKEKNSIYNKFLDKLESASSAKFEVKHLPPLRAKALFKESQGCFFPLSLDSEKARNSSFILSHPIGEILLHGVRLKGSHQKKNKNFSYLSIYSEGVSFSLKNNSYEIEKVSQLFGMLDRARVGYIYVSIPDIYYTFKNGKKDFDKKYEIDPSIPVKTVRDYFACKKGPTNKMVVDRINKVL